MYVLMRVCVCKQTNACRRSLLILRWKGWNRCWRIYINRFWIDGDSRAKCPSLVIRCKSRGARFAARADFIREILTRSIGGPARSLFRVCSMSIVSPTRTVTATMLPPEMIDFSEDLQLFAQAFHRVISKRVISNKSRQVVEDKMIK
jgi:hypothetical protein